MNKFKILSHTTDTWNQPKSFNIYENVSLLAIHAWVADYVCVAVKTPALRKKKRHTKLKRERERKWECDSER